ncbi:hypothetical protein J2741_001882 [Methanolinea mesophila]|uniref:hypothetical protein n=1 Tax=Methanolinea mesophila TaxID=547055 RepID=UPI001AE2D300|nr:hypothetical protein [Methanolinea mesophila]MBP1929335.1 hypothetical protein [Methanolinea mesophila]
MTNRKTFGRQIPGGESARNPANMPECPFRIKVWGTDYIPFNMLAGRWRRYLPDFPFIRILTIGPTVNPER